MHAIIYVTGKEPILQTLVEKVLGELIMNKIVKISQKKVLGVRPTFCLFYTENIFLTHVHKYLHMRLKGSSVRSYKVKLN